MLLSLQQKMLQHKCFGAVLWAFGQAFIFQITVFPFY